MKLQCDIQLPASKSESNRALMIAAYGGFVPDIQNLSDSQDTLVLAKAIECVQQRKRIIDADDCGTAARFMTAYLATQEGDWLLTGSERMCQRPMAPLVEALNELGADIHYTERQGFLPLRIHGKHVLGGKVAVDMSQSSQFASSLLLASPMWPQGLELELLGQLNSLPYLDMTLSIMRHFGALAERNDRKVVVKSKPYQSKEYTVSADWSAASYWYEIAALSEDCEIRLRSLSSSKGHHNIQGDAIIAEWMNLLGVMSTDENDMIVLRKSAFVRQSLTFDFSSNPDLFPTMAATCAGMQVEARFMGVAHLGIKESDRILSMKTELAKIGIELECVSNNELVMKPLFQLPFFGPSDPLLFNAHGDHRVLMALAPLSMKLGNLIFDHPEVVGKSYPDYWKQVSFLRFCYEKPTF